MIREVYKMKELKDYVEENTFSEPVDSNDVEEIEEVEPDEIQEVEQE